MEIKSLLNSKTLKPSLGSETSTNGKALYSIENQESDFATLGSYRQGLPNLQEQRYNKLAQELLYKEAKRALLSAAQSAFVSVNNRGRNSA